MQILASKTQDQARKIDAALAARRGLDVCDVPADERCKYPSKPCLNTRAAKAGGKLHRFCEFHRLRANGNQRRWTSIKRHLARCEREAAMVAMANSPTGFHVPFPDWYTHSSLLHYGQQLPQRSFVWPQAMIEDAAMKPSTETELSEVDIEILTSLLIGQTNAATV